MRFISQARAFVVYRKTIGALADDSEENANDAARWLAVVRI